jgi:surface repeat SSSPR-51 protein
MTAVNSAPALAVVNTDKVGTLTAAVGTATINKVQEAANKAIEMDYSVNITVPNTVKSGDTVRISTINLGDFIPAGETNAPVTIDGVEVGTLARVENNNKRYEQNSPNTSLDHKKAANIEAGTQDNAYVLTFNSKAAEYQGKKVQLKATSSLVYATTVNKNTNIRAQVFMNGQLLATKDYTLTATAPSPEVKSQKSALDYSRNTRMQVINAGGSQTAQNFLGSIFLPLDKDYGKGSTIEVTLPADSMIKFTPATDFDGTQVLTHFPLLKEGTFANGNNVYLYDQSKVLVRAKSITDNKVVYEVVEGTLRRGDSYVGLPNQTGVNFVLTDKAAGKLNAEGTKIGTETVTSVFKTADGAAGETQGNQLSISINGAKVTAEGIKDIAAKKVTTKWVVEKTNKNLKDPVTDVAAKAKEDFQGYVFVKTETDDAGNVTHYYREATKTVTTEWMYTNGEVLKAKVTDEKAHPKEDFEGAIYKETKVDRDGNTVHLYTKVVTPTTETVTNHVEYGTSKVLKPQEKGEQPKATIEGYTFVESKKDDAGNVTHYYKPVVKETTRYVEKGTDKELDKTVDGKQPKKDISGYTFVETKTDETTGVTTHYYEKTPAVKEVTRYVEKGTDKELEKQVDGKQPKKDIAGYTFVETKTDTFVETKTEETTGVTTHYYEKAVKVVTKHVDAETGKDIKPQEDGVKDKATIDGYTFKETKTDDAGNVTHYYTKNPEVKKVTRFVDKESGKEIDKQVDGDQPKKDIAGYTFVETNTDDKTGVTTHYYKKAAATTTSSSADTKKADKKAAVETAGGIEGVAAPLAGVIASAIAGVGAYFGLGRKNKGDE